MKTLSIFIDESGDFGPYERHSPFYLFSLVFHDQSNSISNQIIKLEDSLEQMGLSRHQLLHAGPIIRNERTFNNLDITERRKLIGKAISFAKSTKISYTYFCVEKHTALSEIELVNQLSKKLKDFLSTNFKWLSSYQRIIVYYDNGQTDLTKIIVSVFNAILNNTVFRKVTPSEYRLFQIADLFCTLELVFKKSEMNTLSKSESIFFGTSKDMRKNYFKPIRKMLV